jgi:hypothetical protein
MFSVGRAAAAALVALFGGLIVVLPAPAADPPPLPRPDPPPIVKRAPPPPVVQPAAPQPVAPQPVAPAPAPVAVAPAPVAPAVKRPTAADRRARAARRAARAEAARIRAAVARLSHAPRREKSRAPLVAVSDPGPGSSTSTLPFLLVALATGLLFLGLALTPAWAIRWSRVSHVLEERRDELGVLGAMSIVATALFFVIVEVAM